MKAKYVRVFDNEIGESVIVPFKAINHTTKARRGQEFRPTCAACGQSSVLLIKEVIQYGFLSSLHWLNVYCDRCGIVTIHKYEIDDSEE